jgi:hypothetical protein
VLHGVVLSEDLTEKQALETLEEMTRLLIRERWMCVTKAGEEQ